MESRWDELLTAERRARALLQRHGVGAGDVWNFADANNPDGLALLAAARLTARWDAEVGVAAAAPDHASEARLALLESCRRLGLRVDGNATKTRWSRIRNGHESTGGIPDGNAAWSTPLADAAPWVKRADSGCAPLACAQCRDIDRRAIGDFAVPGVCLMENAAVGAVIVAMDMLAHSGGSRVGIVAGGGNNGGDGLAMARGFAALGVGVEVALMKPPGSVGGDAGINLKLLRHGEIPLRPSHDRPEGLDSFLADKDLIVDGLLGTGFTGGLSPRYRAAIAAVNARGAPVLSLDLPSGLNGDDGRADGDAVRATRTVTFAAVKHGLLADAASEYVGELFLADIGVPRQTFPTR